MLIHEEAPFNNYHYIVLKNPMIQIHMSVQYILESGSILCSAINIEYVPHTLIVFLEYYKHYLNIEYVTHVVVITSNRASSAIGRIGFFLSYLFCSN